MAALNLTVNIHVPRWVFWYVRCVGLCWRITGMDADRAYSHVERVALKHMKVRTSG